MKREIKFGAWIPRLEMMLYGITLYADGMIGIEADKFQEALTAKNPNWKLIDDEIYFSDEDHFDLIMSILPGDEWVWIEAEQCEPVEFTGLKDKNGKDIYDGDIVKYNDFYEGDYREKGGIGFIQWDEEGHYVAKWGDKEEYICSTWDLAKNYGGKIIGNIYENSDLIN